MKQVHRKIFYVGIVALLVAGGGSAAVGSTHYKWLNDRGEPIYSDRPPPKGVDYEVLSTQSRFKRVVSGEEGVVPLETSPRPGNEFDQETLTTAQSNKKNPEYCKQAQENLEALTTSLQVKVRNDQGEVRILSPEQMEAQRVTAREQIDRYCD